MKTLILISIVLIQIASSVYTVLSLAKLFENNKLGKLKISLVIASSICSIFACSLAKGLFPLSNTLVGVIFIFFIFRVILKFNTVKSFILTVFNFIFVILSEIISYLFTSFIFRTSFENMTNNINLSLVAIVLQFLIIILLLRLLKYFLNKFTKINTLIEHITTKQLLIFLFLLVICICPQLVLFLFNEYNSYSIYFLIINCIQMILFCIVIFNYLNKALEKNKIESDLITTKLHNDTMSGMIDGVKTLKHDYNNIIQALNGYVLTKQYDKLEEHINKVLKECNIINTLGSIDPKIFNDPAIYGIVGAKYFLITGHDVTMDLEVITDVKEISFPMPELSRILGILLDNAYEATQKCNNPYVKLEMKFDRKRNADIIRVINTYDTSINIDLESIYKKGVSSKKKKSGIGLWEVKKIISKQSNSQIYPTIEKDKFVQNIIIEKNI